MKSLQLPPTIVDFKTQDLESYEITEFSWKGIKSSNYTLEPNLLLKIQFIVILLKIAEKQR